MMLYAAPIWSQAMTTTTYARQMTMVNRRSAVRVTRAFRTVSYDAVCVIGDMPRIQLLAEKRTQIYRSRYEEDEDIAAREIISGSREKWQQQWDKSTKGRWTYRLIPNIAVWSTRKHGEVDHYLTQLLTGHGCFRAYQYRFRLDDDASCPACRPVTEDV